MENGRLVVREPWVDEVRMSAEMRMVADKLSKMHNRMNDGWKRNRDEWHSERENV